MRVLHGLTFSKKGRSRGSISFRFAPNLQYVCVYLHFFKQKETEQ